MKNEVLSRLEGLIGRWKLTLTDAVFLERPDEKVEATSTFEWISDAFIMWHWIGGDDPAQDAHLVFGRSDANDRDVAIYHDGRGVCRIFEMTFGDGQWTLTREDPDFHQRFIATVEADRIEGRWEASEDAGATWRKDFDLIFERAG